MPNGLYYIIAMPLLFILTTIVIPASLNISLGVRQFYVNTLRKIFQFGREKINLTKVSNGDVIIDDDDEQPIPSLPSKLFNEMEKKKNFHLADMIDFTSCGIQAIVEDEVTKCFSAEELPSWNLLTRTNRNYQFISTRLTVLWLIGWCVRYLILLPVRITLLTLGLLWLCLVTTFIGALPKCRLRTKLNHYAYLVAFRLLARSIAAHIKIHNRENLPKGGGICVANHTSPLDVAILSTDNCYAMVGQIHGGFLGTLQRIISRSQSHVWFERFEIRDRETVTRRLREHVEDTSLDPMLIFPEGTCINNTSVFMFKKGSFEIGGTVYPVAIKYDPTFGDPFWNSSQESYVQYLLMIFTSWALVVDVWYLPPMNRKENESATDFANRVKALIAEQGGLVDLVWDGQLKRVKAKESLKLKEQEEYSRLLKVD